MIPAGIGAHVAATLREAAQAAIMPRFERLAAGEVEEKAPGEVVTVADREAERLIAARLAALLPGSAVVGEEMATQRPALLDGLATGRVWLVDPLDGTDNFVAGRPCFATMAALLDGGETVGAWIFDPVRDVLWAAERGAGAWAGSERLRAAAPPDDPAGLRGAVLTRFLTPGLRARVDRGGARLGAVLPGLKCSGIEYPEIVRGLRHFALYWRALPWDHAPGALLLQEAGGRVARPDGRPYRPAEPGPGLLAAASPGAWDAVRAALLDE